MQHKRSELGEGKKGVPETRGFVVQATALLKTTDGCLCGPTVTLQHFLLMRRSFLNH